jgi:hypothetical protein
MILSDVETILRETLKEKLDIDVQDYKVNCILILFKVLGSPPDRIIQSFSSYLIFMNEHMFAS